MIPEYLQSRIPALSDFGHTPAPGIGDMTPQMGLQTLRLHAAQGGHLGPAELELLQLLEGIGMPERKPPAGMTAPVAPEVPGLGPFQEINRALQGASMPQEATNQMAALLSGDEPEEVAPTYYGNATGSAQRRYVGNASVARGSVASQAPSRVYRGNASVRA